MSRTDHEPAPATEPARDDTRSAHFTRRHRQACAAVELLDKLAELSVASPEAFVGVEGPIAEARTAFESGRRSVGFLMTARVLGLASAAVLRLERLASGSEALDG